MNVVLKDVPLLLVLDASDNEKLVANKVQNELQATYHGWSMPLIRKHRDLYPCGIWNQSCLPSRKSSSCIVTLSILLPGNCTKPWNVHDRSKLMKQLDNCCKRLPRRINLSNIQRASTTRSSFATTIRYCFQPWSVARSNFDWEKGCATRCWNRDRIQFRDVSVLLVSMLNLASYEASDLIWGRFSSVC